MKDFSAINDNELIYLIKNNNEKATLILIEKYKRFIYLKMKELYLRNKEDCYQEGLIILFNSVRTYNEKYNKSFQKYFEILLTNKFIDIKRQQERESSYLVLMEEKELEFCSYLCEDDNNLNFHIDNRFLSKLTFLEKTIFYDYFLQNMTIDEISEKQNMEKKNIYYTIYRIREKIKKYMVK